MTSNLMPVTSEIEALPQELNAKFRYLCQSRTVHGSLQAKCYFLHDDKEYSGILFSPDNEEWFSELEPGTILKAERISPCLDERYAGEYKGTALPLANQYFQKITQPETISTEIDDALLMLREALNIFEFYKEKNKGTASKAKRIKPEKNMPRFRSSVDWSDIISSIIGSNTRFQVSPFSAISINAYIESSFDDFWEGDLTKMHRDQPRWRRMVSAAISQLLHCGFIERVPGTQKHYQVTKNTLEQLF
jgi:hypothetical protein